MTELYAVFVKTDGKEETDLSVHELRSDRIEEASDEARAHAPEGTNLIKICAAGHVVCRIGIGF